MKIEGYIPVKSSFLSIEKDMKLITDKMLKNERLKKLLYYTTPDCLSMKNLTEDESLGLFGKNIKIIPKLSVDGEVLTYVIVSFDSFIENMSNPEFRDNVIEFDIVCHFDQWRLKDFELRPYRIAAEIDTMFNNKKLTGIGKLQFLGAKQIVLTDEFAGICLMYEAIHGEEDKIHQPNPNNEKPYAEDFKKLFSKTEEKELLDGFEKLILGD